MNRWTVLVLMTFAQAGASIVQQALGSLSPLLLAHFALTKSQLGIAFGATMLGAACLTAVAGLATDRWGERRIIAVSAVVMSLGLFACAFAPSYALFVVAIFAFGLGYAATTPAGGRAVLTWFDRDRGLAMSIRQTGVSLGGLVGALTLLPLAKRYGLGGAFVAAAIAVLIPAFIAVALYRENVVRVVASWSSVRRGMVDVARDPRFLAVTATSMGLVTVQLVNYVFLTVTAVNVVGISPALAAIVFACVQVAAIVGRIGWGIASDRVFNGDRVLPYVFLCVFAAVGCGMLALVRHGEIVLLFAAAIVLGLSGTSFNGLMATIYSEIGGANRAGASLGLGLTAVFGASAFTPGLIGAVADHTSLAVAWSTTGLLVLIAAIPTFVQWRRGSPALSHG